MKRDFLINYKCKNCNDIFSNTTGAKEHKCVVKSSVLSDNFGNGNVADLDSSQHLEENYKSLTHSQFGHYFCSNLYGCAPRGPRDVQKSDFFFKNESVEFLR